MIVIFTVSLLGKFQILYKGNVLHDGNVRSAMLVKLLAYLLLNRAHASSVQELSDALWQENETENPAGALKNLMYRLRKILKRTFGEEEFIRTNRGAYSWNPEIRVLIDTEEFEAGCRRAREEVDKRAAIACYEEAIELYQGSFLAKYDDSRWILPAATYFHSLFLSSSKNLAELYEGAKDYESMERVCVKALKYDMADEQIHCLRIRSMIRQNKQQLAEEYYDTAVKVLYQELGVRNTQGLQKIHKELLRMKKSSIAARMEEIHQDMQEPEEPEGAYICGYAMFREAYRMEARRIERLGMAEYVLLLTLTVDERCGKTENVQMEYFMLDKAMNNLEGVVKESLRIGDVAARYSDTQFVILLPACSYEAGMMVAARIISKFQNNPGSKRIRISSDIKEVTSSDPFER